MPQTEETPPDLLHTSHCRSVRRVASSDSAATNSGSSRANVTALNGLDGFRLRDESLKIEIQRFATVEIPQRRDASNQPSPEEVEREFIRYLPLVCDSRGGEQVHGQWSVGKDAVSCWISSKLSALLRLCTIWVLPS